MLSPTPQPISPMASKKKPSRVLISTRARVLSAKGFLDLADVSPEIEWFANITNPQTQRAYQNDLKDFMRFARGTVGHSPGQCGCGVTALFVAFGERTGRGLTLYSR